MSFEISITDNIKEVQKELTRIQREQIPFAAAKALSDTAWDAQRAVTKQIPQKLDRPTKFTRGAIGVKRATKTSLAAEVFVKPNRAGYLKWQIEGGTRTARGRHGSGIPTRNKKLNKYGNIPGRKTGLVKGKKQFVGTIRGITGVWERFGGKRNPQIKLLVRFEKQVRYQRRLPFYKIVSSVVSNRFAKNFDKSIRLALSTMR